MSESNILTGLDRMILIVYTAHMTRPLCSVCHKRKVRISRSGGKEYFSDKCETCQRNWTPEQIETARIKREEARRLKKFNGYVKLAHCERCLFVAEDSCQLDIDHIDGNKDNNNHDNLMTLCANCHRLKTRQNRDWHNRYKTRA